MLIDDRGVGDLVHPTLEYVGFSSRVKPGVERFLNGGEPGERQRRRLSAAGLPDNRVSAAARWALVPAGWPPLWFLLGLLLASRRDQSPMADSGTTEDFPCKRASRRPRRPS